MSSKYIKHNIEGKFDPELLKLQIMVALMNKQLFNSIVNAQNVMDFNYGPTYELKYRQLHIN